MTEEKYHQIIEVNFAGDGIEVPVLADIKRGFYRVTHITYVGDAGQAVSMVELTAPLRINGRDIFSAGLPMSLISPDPASESFNLMREIEPPAEGDGTRFECKLICPIDYSPSSGRFVLTLEK
jgi:hypothetical protein